MELYEYVLSNPVRLNDAYGYMAKKNPQCGNLQGDIMKTSGYKKLKSDLIGTKYRYESGKCEDYPSFLSWEENHKRQDKYYIRVSWDYCCVKCRVSYINYWFDKIHYYGTVLKRKNTIFGGCKFTVKLTGRLAHYYKWQHNVRYEKQSKKNCNINNYKLYSNILQE